MTDQPPADVLTAFGLSGGVRRLTGGKGGTWQSGDIVLKRAEGEPETIWRAEVLSVLPPSPDFRIARPLRARTGAWVVSGWEATAWVGGAADPSRPDDVIRAGEAFHAAITAVPRPSFLDDRDDPWSYGDRLAFGEPVPSGATAPSALLEPLLAARRAVTSPSQVVHGDLTGNVLFAPGLPPAIIDWPAYHRPPSWAAAVVVADALVWHDVDPALIHRWAPHFPEWPQMLIRALIYRISTWPAARWDLPPDDAYRPTVTRVLEYAGR
ncbi:TIGR02569 family protein [Actinoplanes sp. NBRC 103695]|uniref:TIGR02569 family protein n=1 Tax=Actinoplanes sp. NBRC 103695 TaxID=3032202 RepID=UPI0024A3E055|nr:TIGR02569 family protein [Actinoplanes sp. NBRC 103695]GLY97676.1 TIGR02569 family protein [Actinoplanes sp. NBRC 103695]